MVDKIEWDALLVEESSDGPIRRPGFLGGVWRVEVDADDALEVVVSGHDFLAGRLRLVARVRARRLASSFDSLRRYELPSIETTSDRWTSRSTIVTTHVALGKTSPHSAKGLFVEMMVGRFS